MLQGNVQTKVTIKENGLRKLTQEEWELVAGGSTTDIVVTAPGGGGGNYGGPGGDFGGDPGVDPGPDDRWDPNGDDDGDGILNQHEEIIVQALDARTMQAIQGASDLMAKSLMALGILGTGGVGTSVGAYYSQLLSAVMGSAKAGEILAYLTGVAAGSYAEQDLKDVIAEGMIQREQQDLADDGVRNMSWHDTWD